MAVAIAYDILLKAEKLTLGQDMMVYVPHQVLTLLEQRGGYWLMAGRTSCDFTDNSSIESDNSAD